MRRVGLALVALASCSIPEFHFPPAPPAIDRFEIEPFEAPAGSTLTARWSVIGADRVTLGPPGVAPHDVAAEGSETFVLDADLELELVALGPGGTTRAVAAARVFDPRAVRIDTFEVTPRAARPGDPVSVVWATSNATRVSLYWATGEAIDARAPADGVRTLRAESDFGVELHAEGHLGPATASAFVEVRAAAPRIERLHVVPQVVAPGSTGALQWEVHFAELISVVEVFPDGRSGVLYEGPGAAISGTIHVSSEGGSRELVLRATNTAGSAAESTRLIVLEPRAPEVSTFTATPTVSGPDGQVMLRWETRHATRVTLLVDGISVGTLDPFGAGPTTVSGTTVLTLTAANDASPEVASADVTIEVDPARPRLATALLPPRLGLGETATIAWTAERATHLELRDGAGTLVLTSTEASGQYTFTPTTSGSIITAAHNQAGATYSFAQYSVARRPVILELSRSDDVARAGRPVTFRWRTEHATSGELADDTGSINRGIDSTQIADHSEIIAAPAFTGSRVVGLYVRNARFSDSAAVGLQVLTTEADFAETEPNDTSATANGPYFGEISRALGVLEPDDVDQFHVVGRSRTRLTLTTRPTSAACPYGIAADIYAQDLRLRVIGPLARVEPETDCAEADARSHPELALMGSEVVIALRRTDDGIIPTAGYTLVAAWEDAVCSDGVLDYGEACDDGNAVAGDGCSSSCELDGLDEVEPNNTLPQVILPNRPFAAFLNNEDFDLYAFEILPPQAGPAVISLASPDLGSCQLDAEVALYDEALRALASEDPPGDGCPLIAGPAAVLEPGVYWLSVRAGTASGGLERGRYVLTVSTP